jgi:HEAT repeat protein
MPMQEKGNGLFKDNRPDDLTEQASRSLSSWALGDEDPLTRKHAIYLLSMSRNPDDIDTFVRGLRDPEKAVRGQAARALADLGEPALQTLIFLLADPDWKVRYRAAEALGVMKRVEPRDTLRERLTDENDHVRYMAVKALGGIGDHSDREAVRACLQDKNPYVRKMARTVLGE